MCLIFNMLLIKVLYNIMQRISRIRDLIEF